MTGDSCLSEVHITGPSVIESGSQPFVELTCSFHFLSSEYNQLDIKWYFDTEEEPSLQWVPSSGRQPQTIGQRFKSRVKTRHVLTNTTHGYKTDQVIRVFHPSIHTSGDYHCKVATFTEEDTSSHSLMIFDPGAGPFLSYSSHNLSCSASQVFPEPKLSLSWYSEPDYDHHMGDMTTTTVRRGLMYDVSVKTMLSSSLSHQTVFSCSMEIPGTQFSLNKKTMYSPDTRDIARASQVSDGNTSMLKCHALLLLLVLWEVRESAQHWIA